MHLRRIACWTFAGLLSASAVFAANPLPRSAPERQGVSSPALQKLVEELTYRDLGLHGIMIVRHGQVIAEGWWTPYAAKEPHTLYSLSKSFTSTAIGMAQAEGRLSIDDPVLKFFPEDAPAAPSDKLRAMRIRDLLMMSTGQHAEDIDKVGYFGEVPPEKQFLAMPVHHKPGTLFYYNTPASYMLSAIIQKVTGQTTLDYLKPRLFDPLGIEQPMWERSERGVSLGGFGLHLPTEAIAKFGQLYLQRGEWQGRRLLPAEWVDVATSRQASNGSDPTSDWDQGYGYQFWRCRPGFYRGDGAFGQFCIVMPQYDTVVAINSGSANMGGIMSLLWEKLLPELRPEALPENPEASARLQNALGSLRIPVPMTLNGAPMTEVLGRRYVLESNDTGYKSITLVAEGEAHVLVLEGSSGTVRLNFHAGDWAQAGTVPKDWLKFTPDFGDPAIATSGTWTAADTFTGKVAFYQTPNVATLTLKFADKTVITEWKMNVAFGPNPAKTIRGNAD